MEENKAVDKLIYNYNIDVGALIVEDCQSYTEMSHANLIVNTQKNLSGLFSALFELKKKQRLEAGGEDGEILEHQKSRFNVEMPKRTTLLPREKPIPKEKELSKWEKFRIEKGMTTREKRSKMVFDPITQDHVPRQGMGSIKKIAERHNWLMEEKPRHREADTDPFTYKKNEKKIEKEKQELRELKNTISQNNTRGKGKKREPEILDSFAGKKPDAKILSKRETDGIIGHSLKKREDGVRDNVKKREKKALMKNLQLAQISTASMGKFDTKVNKHEPDAPKSQIIKKKKSNKKLFVLESNTSMEKARNLKVLSTLGKEKEIKDRLAPKKVQKKK